MLIHGMLGDDRADPPRWITSLPHGQSVERVVWEQGDAFVAPLRAWRGPDGDIVLAVSVVPAPDGPGPAPSHGRAAADPDLVLAPGEEPQRRQRIAAYALVRSDRGLLGTEYSDRTGAPGTWGLPGGGIDDGEEPVAAVVREIVEETSQHVEVGALVRVQTSHWVGRAPNGTLEDFHAVRLVYLARCPEPSDPVVLDVGGTTSQARWVAEDDLDSVPWTPGWRSMLVGARSGSSGVAP